MKILFPGSFLLFFTACFTLEGTIKIFYNKTGVRGKGTHEKKKNSQPAEDKPGPGMQFTHTAEKSSETIKENAKGRGESLEKEEKER